ncbi:Os02g0524950 [Oryza sativa Japonica Group]|uniref:Os02g0524950 protein n=1 Tax=Oryza sativa subsp. japonica TaxID=39947 RepID=A0A0N7KFE3_ORYSJ|nr:Os02g0524950 [Oryza sativa Japonica Group]
MREAAAETGNADGATAARSRRGGVGQRRADARAKRWWASLLTLLVLGISSSAGLERAVQELPAPASVVAAKSEAAPDQADDDDDAQTDDEE